MKYTIHKGEFDLICQIEGVDRRVYVEHETYGWCSVSYHFLAMVYRRKKYQVYVKNINTLYSLKLSDAGFKF